MKPDLDLRLAYFLDNLPDLLPEEEPTFACLPCKDTGFLDPRKAPDGYFDARPCLDCRQGRGITAGIWFRRVYPVKGGRVSSDSREAKRYMEFLSALTPAQARDVGEVFEAAKASSKAA